MARNARLLLAVVVSILGISRAAQPGSVEFELGFQGAVVENAWNPLRLVLRDQPAVEFELLIDQGSLRSGNIPLAYRVPLPASRGLTVFEDEVFVPAWSSLSWTVRTAHRTVASGALDPRLGDGTPLTLLLSNVPGRWFDSLPGDARPQEVAPGSLPGRAAAYSGVQTIVIDGSTAAPSLGSVAAAAAAGVVVVLVEPLPESHANLSTLLPQGNDAVRIGAGWLVATRPADVARTLTSFSGFPLEAGLGALLQGGEEARQPPLTRMTMVAAGAVYSLMVVLLLRFGGTAGVPSALVVAILSAIAGWTALRPERAVIEQPRTIVVSAGGLGLAVPTVALRSLPGGEVLVPSPMRLNAVRPYVVSEAGTRLTLDRWQRQLLVGRPALATTVLEWSEGRLINLGQTSLTDVVVVGLGPQGALGPGMESEALASEESLSGVYGDLLSLLPAGSAVARAGERFFVTLPRVSGGNL